VTSRHARALRCTLLACAAALAVSGCAAATSSQTVTGKTLDIYVSAPASAANNVQEQDVLNAEKLAFHQLQGTVTSFKLNLVPVGGPALGALYVGLHTAPERDRDAALLPHGLERAGARTAPLRGALAVGCPARRRSGGTSWARPRRTCALGAVTE